MTVVNVLVLVGNDTEVVERLETQYSSAGLLDALTAAAQRKVNLTIVTRAPEKHSEKVYSRHADIHSLVCDKAPMTDRLLAAVGAARIRTALTTTPLGRLINSLSATDPSRVFARAYKNTPVRTEQDCDLIVALDVTAIRAAWLFATRHRSTGAVLGEAAAIAYLSKER